MAREEFDESLYRRPEKKDAGEGEEENKKTEDLPKNDAAPIGDDPADEWKRRSAWDDDEDVHNLYSFDVDPDGYGLTIHTWKGGSALVYFKAGPPVNRDTLALLVIDP